VPALLVRRLGAELLDDPLTDSGLVAASLRNIARSNRWFGGAAALRFGLSRVLRGVAPGTKLTLLDLGTGLGDLPCAATRWAARRRIELVPIGLDRHPAAARLARAGGLPMIVGCAGAPPVGEKSIDLVAVSMLAHHFEPDSVVQLFRACDRIARRAVVITDLRRAGLAVMAFRWGSRLLRFDPVTRADGMTSIRRGFTVAELGSLLATADVSARVFRRPGWRLVATWAPGVP
jgi:hypothetical protein